MEGKDVISFIAVCVTLLLGVIGFIINSFIQRKSNSISVITKTRLNRREKTKTLMAKMIKLSSIEYLDSLDKEDKKATVKELVEVTADIRSEYSQIFECDRDLISSTESLKDSVISYMNSNNDANKESLICKRKEFIKEMDLYIQTEWKRIKLETVGKMKNNNKHSSWDEIYDAYQKDYQDALESK